MIYTPREIKLLKFALEQKFLTIKDVNSFYKTPLVAQRTIARFISDGLIIPLSDFGNKFEINENKINELI